MTAKVTQKDGATTGNISKQFVIETLLGGASLLLCSGDRESNEISISGCPQHCHCCHPSAVVALSYGPRVRLLGPSLSCVTPKLFLSLRPQAWKDDQGER